MTKIKIMLYVFFVLMLFNPMYVFLILCGLVNVFGILFLFVLMPTMYGYWKFWLYVRGLDVQLDDTCVKIVLGRKRD